MTSIDPHEDDSSGRSTNFHIPFKQHRIIRIFTNSFISTFLFVALLLLICANCIWVSHKSNSFSNAVNISSIDHSKKLLFLEIVNQKCSGNFHNTWNNNCGIGFLFHIQGFQCMVVHFTPVIQLL